MTLNRYQDRSGRSGAGFVGICDVKQVPGSSGWSICDVGQIPGSLQGRICDVEQVPGSFPGKICDVARVSYADRVAGLLQGSDLLRYRDVAGFCLVTKNVCFAE